MGATFAWTHGPGVKGAPMQEAMSRGKAFDLEARLENEKAQTSSPDGAVLARLTDEEAFVLDAVADHPTGATMGKLRSACGLSEESLVLCLNALCQKGLVARLNTVVESFCCRFPGVRVP